MRQLLLLAALLVVTACANVQKDDTANRRAVLPDSATALASNPAFLAQSKPAPAAGFQGRSPSWLATTFMELSFAMESGRPLPLLTRFEGEITIVMSGQVPSSAPKELSHLIGRLRQEAGINIRPAQPGETAAITLNFSPRASLRRVVPTAACFVVPNVTTLAQYQANRGKPLTNWANMSERRKVGIFVPSDASAQEIRDCMHEELAQALGPLNDLYRLSDSVFNDDNFHSVLTPTDMQILRAYYSPSLRSGMTKAQVQAKIGAIMAGISTGNAGGDVSATPPAWKQMIETALSPGRDGARRAAAEQALKMARAQGWQDGRLAFSHFARARLMAGSDRARAVEDYQRAAAIWRHLPGGAIHVAHVDMQLAALALASGQPEQAIAYTNRAQPVILRHQNHALLASTQMIHAQALEAMGRRSEAAALRVDSQRSARYGFGSDAQIRAKTREIAAIGGGWFRG